MNIETATRLYEYRKANGYSQEELAAKIGVSRQAISKWERSESSPDTDNLIALAKLYGVSLDTLLMGSEKPKKEIKEVKEETEEIAEEKEKDAVKEDLEESAEEEENDVQESEDGQSGAEENPESAPVQSELTAQEENEPQNTETFDADYNSEYPAPQSANGITEKPKGFKKLSKKTKIIIIAAAAVILLALLAAAAAEIYDEIIEDRIEKGAYPITETTAIDAGTSETTAQSSGSSSSIQLSDGTYSVDSSMISSISVKWYSGNVTVSYYDGTEITFSDATDTDSEQALSSRLDGSELKIFFNQSRTASGSEKDLQINIPNGTELTELDIETTSADINVNGISAAKIDLSSGSGAITAAGAFYDIEAETTSADMQITTTAAQAREIDVETNSGSITLTLPQDTDGFYLEYETISGDISNDFGVQLNGSSLKGTAVYGSGYTQIDVETTTGDFRLSASA